MTLSVDGSIHDTTAVPHTRMRRAIIRAVTASAQVPQYTVEVTVRTAPASALRAQVTERDPQVSFTDLLHAAVARTLADHPLLNASWTENAVVLHHRVHLAFIVEVADGMLTPVIKDADRLGLADLAGRRRALTEQARDGSLGPADLADGTFTVTNLGTLGVRRFSAMVLPPQSAVLAVGAIGDDASVILNLTADHRVVDGATAARFLRQLKSRLEEPADLDESPTPRLQEVTA